jgi:regulator of protease activity HflC (stomatin/prohibitin superfamily)
MDSEFKTILKVAGAIGILGIASVGGYMRFYPEYKVWQQGLAGQAELKRAEQNRKIRIQEARARLESAKLNAQSEVEAAKGAAQANKIMAESLGGADKYLKWKYINMLEENKNAAQIIYVPTEGQMPITEANRLKAGR